MSSYGTHSLFKKERNPEPLSDIGILVISNEILLSYCPYVYSRRGKEAWSNLFSHTSSQNGTVTPNFTLSILHTSIFQRKGD